MRVEARKNILRDERDEKRKEGRTEFIRLVEGGAKRGPAALATGVKPSTASRLYNAHLQAEAGDSTGLRELLNPQGNRAGARSIIQHSEQRLIVQHVKLAERRGFSFSAELMSEVMRAIASDGRKGFKNGTPSRAAIDKFRANNRDITMRTKRPKDMSKLKAENVEHVLTFETALKEVEADYPGIFSDPRRVWNVDETDINSTKVAKEKRFSATASKEGASVADGYAGSGKHVTLVVAINAAGQNVHAYFLVDGIYHMTGWTAPLPIDPKNVVVLPGGVDLRPYCKDGWFPGKGVIRCTPNGSMTIEELPVFLKFLDDFVRETLPKEQSYATLLDGHSSRSLSKIEWLLQAAERNQQCVQAPANTSHFAQACDQRVNSVISQGVKLAGDAMRANNLLITHSTAGKIMCGVIALRRLSAMDVHRSWDSVGLWPMDYRFCDWAREKWGSGEAEHFEEEDTNEVNASRRSDAEIVELLLEKLVDENLHPAVKAQQAAMILKKSVTANSVLQETLRLAPRDNPAPRPPRSKRLPIGYSLTPGGTPAMYLTQDEKLADLQRQREEADAEQKCKEAETLARVQKKALDEVEKSRAREVRAAATAARKRQREADMLAKEVRKRQRQEVAAQKKADAEERRARRAEESAALRARKIADEAQRSSKRAGELGSRSENHIPSAEAYAMSLAAISGSGTPASADELAAANLMTLARQE